MRKYPEGEEIPVLKKPLSSALPYTKQKKSSLWGPPEEREQIWNTKTSSFMRTADTQKPLAKDYSVALEHYQHLHMPTTDPIKNAIAAYLSACSLKQTSVIFTEQKVATIEAVWKNNRYFYEVLPFLYNYTDGIPKEHLEELLFEAGDKERIQVKKWIAKKLMVGKPCLISVIQKGENAQEEQEGIYILVSLHTAPEEKDIRIGIKDVSRPSDATIFLSPEALLTRAEAYARQHTRRAQAYYFLVSIE